MNSILSPQNRIFGKSKRSLLSLLVIAIIIYGCLFHNSPKPQVVVPIDIVNQRNTFRNPIYTKLFKAKSSFEKLTLDDKCSKYFSVWKHDLPVDETPISRLSKIKKLDPNIYKKSKWIKSRTISYKKKIDKKRTKQEIRELVEKDYITASNDLSNFEHELVTSISHQRVWGTCFLRKDDLENDESRDILCQEYVTMNFPWISNNFPSFKSWNGEETIPRFDKEDYKNENTKCFFKKYMDISNGRGIVITIFPNIDRKRQIDNIGRLLRVLRMLKNKLPIEIVYFGENWDQRDNAKLIDVARGSFNADKKMQNSDLDSLPKQNIIFVSLTNAVSLKDSSISQAYGSINMNSMLILSSIFNSFSEAIMMTHQTIPLAEDLEEILFNNEGYKKNGILLFKNPSYYTSHTKYFNSGYFEVQDLVYSHLMASEMDQKYFKLALKSKSSAQHTDRVFKDNFNDLMDPNFFVLRKGQTLSGLLISFNLQLYDLLSTRFHTNERFNVDLFWLGQELAGSTEILNFNNHYGVAAGLVTPSSNIPRHLVTYSNEICTSSWGQLSDVDDNTLIYVTSHQLENAMRGGPGFEADLKNRYSTSDIIGNPEDYNAILTNPLYIADVLNPPVISKPQTSEGPNEPSKSWIDQEKNDVQYYSKYYCSYNIVGGIESNSRTKLLSFGEKVKSRLNNLIELWYRKDI